MTGDDLLDLNTADLIHYAESLRNVLRRLNPQSSHHQADVQMERGAVVAGAGRGLTVSNPDVRKLIEDCHRAGATYSMAGDGHWKIEYQGRSANISATPRNRRSVLNDRARVRRKLGLPV